jgi:endonuclease YncB( thermonuclease family)
LHLLVALSIGSAAAATSLALLHPPSASRVFHRLVAPEARLAAPSPSQVTYVEHLRGQAAVIDGDTLTVAGSRVRLFGIDAPEARQSCSRDGRAYACGAIATEVLTGLLAGVPLISCERMAMDQYGRIVARCLRGDGLDIGAEMVQRGWAVAFRRYSDDYIGLEERARFERRGIWAGTFEEPSSWRLHRR